MQDMFLTCNPRWVRSLADEITDVLIEQHAEATILLYGITTKQKEGFLVIEWEETVPNAFRERMAHDQDITDFVIYDVPVCDHTKEKE